MWLPELVNFKKKIFKKIHKIYLKKQKQNKADSTNICVDCKIT